MLNVGDTAPDFALPDQSGAQVDLDDLLAEGDLILYFYPADFSPVCTAEACVFRDNYDGLTDIGTQIVGVSPQGVSSHKRFAQSFAIPFPILSDTRKQLVRAFGVDGMLGMGVRRATFLIDQERIIQKRVVSDLMVTSHASFIKEMIREGGE